MAGETEQLITRVTELESILDYAVDAGWADGLVRALEDVAQGRRNPQEIARRALERAGLWPPSQLQLFEN